MRAWNGNRETWKNGKEMRENEKMRKKIALGQFAGELHLVSRRHLIIRNGELYFIFHAGID